MGGEMFAFDVEIEVAGSDYRVQGRADVTLEADVNPRLPWAPQCHSFEIEAVDGPDDLGGRAEGPVCVSSVMTDVMRLVEWRAWFGRDPQRAILCRAIQLAYESHCLALDDERTDRELTEPYQVPRRL